MFFCFYLDFNNDARLAADILNQECGTSLVCSPLKSDADLPLHVFDQGEKPVVVLIKLTLSKEKLKDLIAKCASVIVIHHHPSAKHMLEVEGCIPIHRSVPIIINNTQVEDFDDLFKCSGFYMYFDESMSASACVQKFFFPDTPLPQIVQLMDDQTMNRNLTEVHRFFSLGLRSYSKTTCLLHVDVDNVIQTGQKEAIEFDRKFAELFAKRKPYLLLDDFECILMEAPPTFANEMATKLKDEESVGFVGTFMLKEGKYQYSLRSINPDFSVLDICVKMGGGGQKAAAGFSSDGAVHKEIIQ